MAYDIYEFNHEEFFEELKLYKKANKLTNVDISEILGVNVRTITRFKTYVSNKNYFIMCSLFDGFEEVTLYKKCFIEVLKFDQYLLTNRFFSYKLKVDYKQYINFLYNENNYLDKGYVQLRRSDTFFMLRLRRRGGLVDLKEDF